MIAAAKELGSDIAQSQMFGCKNIAQGTVIAMHCLQTATPILNYQREYHLIDGKPSMKSEAMLGKFIEKGGKINWVQDGTDGAAELQMQLPGGATVTNRYSIDDAKQAGLIKPNSGWVKNPRNMLRARVVSEAMRMYAPHLVVGCYTPEEIADIAGESAPAVTQPEAVSAPVATSETSEKRGRGRPPKSAAPAVASASSPPSPGEPAGTPQSNTAAAAVAEEMKPVEPAEQVAAETAATAHAATTPSATAADVDTPQMRLDRVFYKLNAMKLPEEGRQKILAKLGVKSWYELNADQLTKLEDFAGRRYAEWLEKQKVQKLDEFANSAL